MAEPIQKSSAPDAASLMQQVLYEVKKVVVGQDHFLERVLVEPAFVSGHYDTGLVKRMQTLTPA